MSRANIFAALGLAAIVLLVLGLGIVLRGREPETRVDLATLSAHATTGRMSGDEAIELARRLAADAFREMAAPAPEERAPVQLPARTTAQQRASLAKAPRTGRHDALTAARTSFETAAATLLQEPDPAVRAAVMALRDPATRADALDRLWAAAEEGGASSAAIWRACGAFMLVADDDRAIAALERARALNPQDRDLWRLLGYGYGQAGRPIDAGGAALVGEGIRAASASNWRGARARFEQALPLIGDGATRGFVLGQIGDAAAALENWADAEQSYRAALEAHVAAKNIAALSLDSSRLARAQLKQGDEAQACRTLRRARAQGAAVTDAEIDQACGAGLRK